VSALVHSSTLVTAGVYLLIRFNFMLGARNFLFFIGVLTIFISGIGANFETDLKKIIALSTLSQLGLIIITLGLGFYEYTFFHLLTHAIFKSLLFLCAGVFIHSMGDNQDIRSMSGLVISCPATSFFFVCSSIALCGFPFLSGFYSKDLILEVYLITSINFIYCVVVILSTIFTLTYSVRLLYYVFFNRVGKRTILNLFEEVGIILPMRLLMFLSIRAGGWMSVNFFPLRIIFLPLKFKLLILVFLIFFFIIVLFCITGGAPTRIKLVGGVTFFLGSI
jgi:NADH-ubiquinone oxidoreductase chain 5